MQFREIDNFQSDSCERYDQDGRNVDSDSLFMNATHIDIDHMVNIITDKWLDIKRILDALLIYFYQYGNTERR